MAAFNMGGAEEMGEWTGSSKPGYNFMRHVCKIPQSHGIPLLSVHGILKKIASLNYQILLCEPSYLKFLYFTHI